MKYRTCYGSAVTVTRKLKTMPSAQAGVIVGEDYSVTLMSYTTAVASIDAEGWLRVAGLFSPTTRRHLSAFMREYGRGADYSAVKTCAEKSVMFNVFSGEVRPC